ncbi:MAG: glycosyltransferase family 2 protein [Candidatus Hermodarchaeota archaeon]
MKVDNRKISIAIPTYNSSEFILNALSYIIDDERVNEIIISDDHSNDYRKLISKIKDISPKIKIFRNKHNLGGFGNKYQAISKCKNKRAILLDSDNSLTENYIDKLFEISKWNSEIIYCPDFAKPNFNYKKFSGMVINKELTRKILIDQKGSNFGIFLNTGNYFVDIQNYIKCIRGKENVKVHSGDVISFISLWLQNNYSLYIVPGLEYNHRIHKKSYSVNTSGRGERIIRDNLKAIINNREYKFKYKRNVLYEKLENIFFKYFDQNKLLQYIYPILSNTILREKSD